MNKKLKVVIIDYGMGNVKSIENAINHISGHEVLITSEEHSINTSDVIILPGVGAFPDAMKKLNEMNLIGILEEVVHNQKKPTLGICLGMQLLFDYSEEKGMTQGLGWIPGKVCYMKPNNNLRVPHIGWNSLEITKSDSIFEYLKEDKDFYFVHSLHAVCDPKYVLARFDYGGLMTAAVQNGNIVGMQFHPEKSQNIGLKALKSFFDWSANYKESQSA